MAPAQDLRGRQFGRLTVAARASKNTAANKRRWRCRCLCGQTTIVTTGDLTSGATQSCGCIHKEQLAQRNTRHRQSKHPLYPIWLGMMQRCLNPNSNTYARYGGRGITICKRWRVVSNFIADIAPRPSPKHSLDRIDNDGNYEPGNVRWATRKQQRTNQHALTHQRGEHRTNRLITAFGKTLHLAEWSRQKGIHRATISTRLKAGWPPTRALTP